MKEYVIKEFEEYLEEIEEEISEESIDNFIAYLTYELKDNLEVECENFCVPKDLEGYEAQCYIEGEIEKILLDYLKQHEIIEMLDDKIIEAENCEEDISENFKRGYIKGIGMAKIIIEELM